VEDRSTKCSDSPERRSSTLWAGHILAPWLAGGGGRPRRRTAPFFVYSIVIVRSTHTIATRLHALGPDSQVPGHAPDIASREDTSKRRRARALDLRSRFVLRSPTSGSSQSFSSDSSSRIEGGEESPPIR